MTTPTSLKIAATNKTLLKLDGSMSTPLEALGADLNHPLWTAKVIKEQPELIEKVHYEYFKAGANITITASYQGALQGFLDNGYTKEEALQAIGDTVRLAIKARDKIYAEETKAPSRWIAGSVGPYGAYLANGAEYRGDYNLSEADYIAFHEARIKTLLAAGADCLALETMPNFEEIKALVHYTSTLPHCLVYVSCTLQDNTHISDGTPLTEVQSLLEAAPHVLAYGINCIKPAIVTDALNTLAPKATKPLVVYPNGGATYDPVTKTWDHKTTLHHQFEENLANWLKAGACWIGACCGSTANDIQSLTELLAKQDVKPNQQP